MRLLSYQAILTMHGQVWLKTLEMLEKIVTLWVASGFIPNGREKEHRERQLMGVREWCRAQRTLPVTVRCVQITPIPAVMFIPEQGSVEAVLLFPLNGDKLWTWTLAEPSEGFSRSTLETIRQVAIRVWQRIFGSCQPKEKVWCYCDWVSSLNPQEQAALLDAMGQKLAWLCEQGWIVGVIDTDKRGETKWANYHSERHGSGLA